MSKNPGIYPDCDVNPYNDYCYETDCQDPNKADVGLGVYRTKRITVESSNNTEGNWSGDLWLFAVGHAPVKVGTIQNGMVYEMSWDHSLDYDERLHYGLYITQEGKSKWLFSNECCITKDFNEIRFQGSVSFDETGDPNAITTLRIDTFVNDDLAFDAAHGPVVYAGEFRMGSNGPGADYEIRLRPDGASPGPQGDITWVNGQEEQFTVSFDPITRKATLTVRDKTLIYDVPSYMDPRTIALRATNSSNASYIDTRAQLYDVVLNGQSLPDASIDTGITPVGTRNPIGKHILTPESVKDGYVISGKFIFSWNPLGATPTKSNIAIQIKFANPPSDVVPLPCGYVAKTYPGPVEFDNDFGWIDYLAEMRWGNQSSTGDQEINFQPGTSGFPIVVGNFPWQNGVAHKWSIYKNPLTNKVVMRIDGVDYIEFTDTASQMPRSFFMFTVAQRLPGRSITMTLDKANGEPVDLSITSATDLNGNAQWQGQSITFPPLTGDHWTAEGTVTFGWDPTDPFSGSGGSVGGSNILAHVKFGSIKPEGYPECGGFEYDVKLVITECCPTTCTKCYDNTVFCHEWHDEGDFTERTVTNPGLPLQVLTDAGGDVQPLRQISLTRSGDALNSDLGLLYGSQKWIMVWDLELNRLIDFFPKAWLRYGAGAYLQQQTLRKQIDPNKSNRVPYYIEEFDLGLAYNGQGSYNLDKGSAGQGTTGWDVPAKLIGLRRDRQQMAPKRVGDNDAMTEANLYAEFNSVAVDAYQDIAKNAVLAQRERFFQDRREFLHHSQVQRFHDQIQFLQKEVSSRMIRLMTDSNEWLKHLVDSFNPETPDSFGNFAVVILNQISNKLLRTRNDKTEGIFAGTNIENDEETSGDWMRYIYGELRRLVEMERIDKKDVQATMLQTLTEIQNLDGENFINALKDAMNIQVIKEQYDLASAGRIAPGGGLSDPDTDEENRIRGLAK